MPFSELSLAKPMSNRQKTLPNIHPDLRAIDTLLKGRYEEDLPEEEHKSFAALNDAWEKTRYEAIPKLTCCPESSTYHAIYFSVDPYMEPTKGRWQSTESKYLAEKRWLAGGEEFPDRPEVKFCPFCASPVPKMRMKPEPPAEIMRCTDGGYYCDTCSERLMECRCLPPEAAFEPED
jgi:hypothetical protein